MPSREDIQRLRRGMSDDMIFQSLKNQDPEFQSFSRKYENHVDTMSPSMRATMPTALLNKFYFGEFSLTGKRPESVYQSADNADRTTPEAERERQSTALGRTIRNVPGSAKEFASSIFSAVTSPFETLGTLADVAVGGAANTVETIAGFAGAERPEDIFDLPSEELASAVGQFYADRYGSLDNIKKTIEEDPVGFVADLTGVLSIVGGGLRTAGRVGQVGAVARTGQAATAAATVIDPVAAAARAVAVPFKRLNIGLGKLNDINIKSAFNLTSGQMQRINRLGKKPSEFLAEHGVTGNTGQVVDELGRIHRNSYEELNSVLSSLTEKLSVSNVQGLSKIMKELARVFNKPGLEDVAKEARALSRRKKLTLSEFTRAKRLIDKGDFIFSKSNEIRGTALAQGAAKIRLGLKTFIEKEAKKRGVPDVAEINRTTQISKKLLDEIASAADKGGDYIRFRDLTIGAPGFFISKEVGLTLLIIERLARFPQVATRLNLIINSLSKPELAIVQKALKTGEVTQDARRILQSIIQAIPHDVPNQSPDLGNLESPLLSVPADQQ